MKTHLIIDFYLAHYRTYCGIVEHWLFANVTKDIKKTTCKSCIKVYEKRKEQK